MIEEKFYTCKYDKPFKEIMLKEENKDVLKKLLENILKIKIKEIEINNQERNTGNIKIRRKHLHALLTTNEGKIEIEVNTSNEKYVHPRNMAYISDIYASHTLVGEEYNEDTKIIQINLSYKIKDEKGYRIYKVRDKEGKEYVKNLIIYELNMQYYMDLWYNKKEEEIEENKYIIMLDLKKEELKKLSKEDKVVSKYMEELDRLNSNPKFREYMSAEEDARKIYNSEIREATEKGLEQGLEIGKKENQIDIAKNLIKMGLTLEQIMEATGLTEEEINKYCK